MTLSLFMCFCCFVLCKGANPAEGKQVFELSSIHAFLKLELSIFMHRDTVCRNPQNIELHHCPTIPPPLS